jgi:2-polyprenyl-6-methoxyphenol hydroxylase-like FAD-dependent oxidoreductase
MCFAGVSVKFLHNDKEVEEDFDIAIGCDGIRSKVRKQMFGSNEPVYSGKAMWWGVTEAKFPEVHSFF